MVYFCINSLVIGMYLYAYDASGMRFVNLTGSASESYKWSFFPDNNHYADRICNLKYNTCIAVAQGRQPHTYEVLALEPSNDNNPYQFWYFNSTTKTVYLNGSYYSWDLQHNNADWEPLQLARITAGYEHKFKLEDC